MNCFIWSLNTGLTVDNGEMTTESTKQLFDAIVEEDIDKVRRALTQSDVDINYQQPVGIWF